MTAITDEQIAAFEGLDVVQAKFYFDRRNADGRTHRQMVEALLSASKPAARLTFAQRDSIWVAAEALEKIDQHVHASELRAMLAASPAAPAQSREPVAFRQRVERLLVELHSEGRLSEGQCAKLLDIHRIEWRKIADDAALAAPQSAQAAQVDEDLVDPLYILSLNEEAMEEAIERFEGSSTGEALKCVLHAQKLLRERIVSGKSVEQTARTHTTQPGESVTRVADLLMRARVLEEKSAMDRARLDRCVSILSRIHSFLLPDEVRLPDGRVFEFSNEAIEREMLRGLCKAIRAVPDELAAQHVEQTRELTDEQTLMHHARLSGYYAPSNELFHYSNGWRKAMEVAAMTAARPASGEPQ